MMNQGKKANKTGKILERLVLSTFDEHGFEIVKHKDYLKNTAQYGQELLLRHVPYNTLYGTRGYSEYLVRSERYALHIRIECKWQQSPGSVDEKFPYTYISCVEAIPEDHVIIILGGDGSRDGAKEWLRQAAKERRYISSEKPQKKIEVFTLTEFMAWANNIFV